MSAIHYNFTYSLSCEMQFSYCIVHLYLSHCAGGMKMKQSIIIAILFLLASCGGGGGGEDGDNNPTTSVNVQGSWQGVTTTQEFGEEQTTFNLNQDGNNISGSLQCSSNNGTYETDNLTGSVNGSSVSISAIFPTTDDGDIEYGYVGTISEDTYTGEVDLYLDGNIYEQGGTFSFSRTDGDIDSDSVVGRIAFVGCPDCSSLLQGLNDIFLINPDGSNKTRLTTTSSHHLYPSLSPDGNAILFTASYQSTGYTQEIFIMNIDGSNLRRMTSNSFDENYPVWSPDSSRIAFISVRDNDIYTISAIDGSGLTRLTSSFVFNGSDSFIK